MAQPTPYDTHTVPLPEGNGYRYVISLAGRSVLTSGEFLMQADALRAGQHIASDEAILTDFLQR